MRLPVSLWLALRYLRARRRQHFVSFITLTSLLGVALGVAVLITVLSVMNGFEEEIRDRLLSAAAHARIIDRHGPLHDWRRLQREVQSAPLVQASAPYVQGEAMLSFSGRVAGAVLQGVLPDQERQVSSFAQTMIKGRLQDLRPASYGIVLGSDLAARLGAEVGDAVTVMTPDFQASPLGVMPRLRRFTVVGLFRIGMYETDSALALVHIKDAQVLKRMGGTVSGLRLQVTDRSRAHELQHSLAPGLPAGLRLVDWTQEHVNFFRAIQTEKRVMFIILLLIVAVAAFNIVSALVMMVTEKRPAIAVLHTLGADAALVQRIFLWVGMLIGLLGTALGTAAGVALALNVETLVPLIESWFHVKFFNPEVYYISEVPSRLLVSDVVLVALLSWVTCVLATLYPARMAARVQPAEVLRYE